MCTHLSSSPLQARKKLPGNPTVKLFFMIFDHFANFAPFASVLAVLFHFCLACEAEARHMYCFSGSGVVDVGGGGVNFFGFRSFSQKL